MIDNIQHFIQYFEGIRKRTLKYINAIPDDKIGWAPRDGEFCFGEIIRHIMAGEQMTVGMVLADVVRYQGHIVDEQISGADLILELENGHAAAMASLINLPSDDLPKKRKAVNGTTVRAWRLLMAMVEHEVHHRSQLAVYLTLIGVEPPQLYDLGVDDVIAASGQEIL